MFVSRFAAIAVISLSLAACASNTEIDTSPKETTGTVVSAIGGAAVGSQFGGGTGGHVAGALVGAGLGALIGNRIGAALDDEDKQRAYTAQIDALDRAPSGAPVSWKNPDSGRYGTIVPGPAFQQAGRNCRSFTHTIYIDGRPQTARGTACRAPDGTWASVG